MRGWAARYAPRTTNCKASFRSSDRHSSLLSNAPALLWSTDEALVLRGIEGAEAQPAAIGLPVGDWDRTAPAADRARVVGAHRDALAGATTTIRVPWLGRLRYLTVSPVYDGDRIGGTAGAALALAPHDDDATGGGSDHDAVTDLPNRAIFEQRVARRCASAKPATSGPRCSSSMSTASRR